ncbi:LysR family transcriptional regulator [Cupriavidus sp. WGlv3]|uniref:helix-turn-helix domain-containing protein n=1 Tax=Cupriavidus sp. WGlv3 TaxID=2919924 RepID=UPI002090B94D|nr:LysR family transcriptional regulator [Cupriavidus sp. WGlv3]MCO4861017.1 LysR family transcriptional regulator [Cupriavidus sp. WGlv3]
MAYRLINRRVSFLSLRVFVALMQHRDASRAAQALGIQPQRLHYQIRQLEAALGRPLFQTCGTSWLPTAAGFNALPKIRAMLEIWEQVQASTRARRRAEAERQRERCAVRVGAAFWVRQATM